MKYDYTRRGVPSPKEVHRLTTKELDAWWTKLLLMPIASGLTSFFLKVNPSLKPNTVTTWSLITGIISAVLFYQNYTIVAAFIYHFCLALDCVDGKVARVQGRSSSVGEFYDGLVNHIVYLLNIVGLAFSGGFEAVPVVLLIGLLWMRALNNYLNESIERETEGTWAQIVPEEQGWLARHGLLYPGTFPDKHALLFFFAPILGFPFIGMGIILVMDVALLAVKIRKAWRQRSARDTQEV